MSAVKRFILLVLDGVGVGGAPDAEAFGDIGANTLGNIARKSGGLDMPNMQQLGLGNILDLEGVRAVEKPLASWGRMREKSQGKDSTLGHWEFAGIITETALPVYPGGFPEELIREFCQRCGVESVLGNKAASGTEIIKELGDAHVRTGLPIVYTSADSVFQIAAHEAVIPIAELYRMCEIARKLLHGEHAVARVIARPFEGEAGNWQRTTNRRDFSLLPSRKISLERAAESGIEVFAIGKIKDLYAGVGIERSQKSRSNAEGMRLLEEELATPPERDQLILLNLVDFDALWGHRLDTAGFAKGLEEFDRALPAILKKLQPGDLLCMTADHGNDPTGTNTDHTREMVPLLVFEPGREPRELGIRQGFTDIGVSMMDFFDLDHDFPGHSFL